MPCKCFTPLEEAVIDTKLDSKILDIIIYTSCHYMQILKKQEKPLLYLTPASNKGFIGLIWNAAEVHTSSFTLILQ